MMIQVLQGDCLAMLRTMAAGSVHCCVTSPPYYMLRSYLPEGHEDKQHEMGSERTMADYIQNMVDVFREVRRVLHDSGTCWINCGDSYAANRGYQVPDGKWCDVGNDMPAKVPDGLKPKDLCLIPWRLVLALQSDGWWVRSIICWAKKSCMPESVTDRPTNSWEPIFLLAKSAKYFYDAEAVRERVGETTMRAATFRNGGNYTGGNSFYNSSKKEKDSHGDGEESLGGRNQRNVWSLGPEPYSEAHFATFPTEIPRRAILAGTSAKGCCPKCGEPWERVVEPSSEYAQRLASANDRGDWYTRNDTTAKRTDGTKHGKQEGGISSEYRTVGWSPGCTCNAKEILTGKDTIPCTVLDPFGGSGTTGRVALELGRKAVLIELNPDYVKLIHQRCDVTPGLQLA